VACGLYSVCAGPAEVRCWGLGSVGLSSLAVSTSSTERFDWLGELEYRIWSLTATTGPSVQHYAMNDDELWDNDIGEKCAGSKDLDRGDDQKVACICLCARRARVTHAWAWKHGVVKQGVDFLHATSVRGTWQVILS
jgi:hypothetical protein